MNWGWRFAIAATANTDHSAFYVLVETDHAWHAMMGGWLGLITAVVLMILGPTIWVQILGHEKAIFPYVMRCSLSPWHSSASGSSRQPITQPRRVSVNCSAHPVYPLQTGFGVEQGRAH